VSSSVNLPLHHKVQKFSSGTGSPGWSWKKSCKTVVVFAGLDVSQPKKEIKALETDLFQLSSTTNVLRKSLTLGWMKRASGLQETCANFPKG